MVNPFFKNISPIAYGSQPADFYPYKIGQSCRFDSASNARTAKTYGVTATDRYEWTFSTWLKRCELGRRQGIWAVYDSSTNYARFEFQADDTLQYLAVTNSANRGQLNTDAVFRDVSSWYHIVGQLDSANQTFKIWVNGVLQDLTTGTAISTDPPRWGTSGYDHFIGCTSAGTNQFDGYLAETYKIDNQLLTASDFGETKQGVWVPKRYTGALTGNATFYFDYSNSSDFGSDQSGNSFDFTDANLGTDDQVEDSPTNNYCTINPLDVTDDTFVPADVSDGNLVFTASQASTDYGHMTFFVPPSGKWYYEMEVTSGIVTTNGAHTGVSLLALYGADGTYYEDGGPWAGAWDAWSNGDIIGVAIDVDSGTVQFFVDNVSQGTLTVASQSMANEPIRLSTSDIGEVFTFNFGQLGFTYTPPAGFKALNSKNLPDASGVSDKYIEGKKGFDVITYEGTGVENAITGLDFSPNLVWLKSRDTTNSHYIYDTVRGATKLLDPATQAAEVTVAQTLKSFDSGGFTMGTNGGGNTNTENYVAWCFKSAPAYGVEVLAWPGTASPGPGPQEIIHTLGVVPELIIVKNRDDGARDWKVYCPYLNEGSSPEDWFLELNTSARDVTGLTEWDSTAPTSSVFTVGDNIATNGDDDALVGYAFASVEGFSKVFNYHGNENVDGPFIYTGFRPRFVMIKGIESAQNWWMLDTERDIYNESDSRLIADTTQIETTTSGVDILSNGFKIRSVHYGINRSGAIYDNYFGIAFAETPFKYANAR